MYAKYPLTPAQLKQAVEDSGCGPISRPTRTKIASALPPHNMTDDLPVSVCDVVQVAASCCVVEVEQPGPPPTEEAAAASEFTPPVRQKSVDMRLLHALLCAKFKGKKGTVGLKRGQLYKAMC